LTYLRCDFILLFLFFAIRVIMVQYPPVVL